MEVSAKDVQRGDVLEGWDGYVVDRFEPHPTRPAVGRIHLLADHPTTAPACWFPKAADDPVTVTRGGAK